MREYDLTVAYRIYPKVSKKPLFFSEDKYMLSELCLKSFRLSLDTLRAKVFVLLDSCPQEYEDLFKKYFSASDLKLIHLNRAGNAATFDLQIKMLLEQDFSDYVYFAEDDYFYLPKQFPLLLRFLEDNQDVDFVSAYDHLDYYTLDWHKHKNLLRIFGGKHWRTANSTCLTFLTTKKVLSETEQIFRSYVNGNIDAAVWVSLTKSRIFNLAKIFEYGTKNKFLYGLIKRAWKYNWKQNLFGRKCMLWVPVPSVATHMESKFLAPNVDWSTIISQKIANTENEDK